MLIASHPFDGNVKPGCPPFRAFRKQYPNDGTGFPLYASSSDIHDSYITPQYDTHIHPRHLKSSVTHNPVMWSTEVVQKLKMGHSSDLK